MKTLGFLASKHGGNRKAYVPVDAHVVGGVVDDRDLDVVALAGEQRGARVLPVHRHDALRAAQPRHARRLHLPCMSRRIRVGFFFGETCVSI